MLLFVISITMTLPDAINRTLENSPLYLQAKKNLMIQQKTNSLFYSQLGPRIYGGYDYLRSYSTTAGVELYDTTRNYSVNASWNLSLTDPVDAFGTHYRNNSVYSSFLDTRDDIVFNVITLYLNALKMEKLLQSKKKAVERTTNNLELVQEKEKLGSASRAEVLKSRVDNLQAQYDLLRTRREKRVAELNLKKIVGLQVSDTVELKEPEIEFNLPGREELIEKSLDYDPLLNKYRADYRAARMDLISKSTNQLFSLSVSGSYGYQDEEFPSSSNWNENDSYSIGLSVSVPLFTSFSRVNEVMISKLQLSLAEIQMSDRDRGLRIEIEDALLSFREAEEKMKVADVTLELAEESYRATRERYELKEASIIELLGAEEDLLQAQYSQTQAVYDYYLSVYKLKRLMGRLP